MCPFLRPQPRTPNPSRSATRRRKGDDVEKSLAGPSLPLLLLLLASGVSRADTTVGSFQSSSTNPFLYNEAPSQSIDYQQVYTSSAFTGTTDIDSLTFYFDNAADRALSQISGTYRVMWGYAAPGSVNGLTTNLAGNFMAPPGILGTFTIPVRRPANNNDNNNVAFTLSGFNFDYNPAKGNLLMEIVINNQQVILNGANRASQGLEADPSGSVTSRAFCMTGMGCPPMRRVWLQPLAQVRLPHQNRVPWLCLVPAS